jgi:hypothetical protein
MTPEARIDRRRRVAFHELEGVEVNKNFTVRVANLPFGSRDQAALGVIEVLLIVKIEFLCKFLIAFSVASVESPPALLTSTLSLQPVSAKRAASAT